MKLVKNSQKNTMTIKEYIEKFGATDLDKIDKEIESMLEEHDPEKAEKFRMMTATEEMRVRGFLAKEFGDGVDPDVSEFENKRNIKMYEKYGITGLN